MTIQFGGGLAGSVTVALVWWLQRRPPKFKSNEIGILVSFRCSGTMAERNEVRAALDALVDLLHADAQSHDLAPLTMVVRKLPYHVRVDSAETAGTIALRSRSVCVIWSQGTAGSVAGDPTIDLGRIGFFVRHRELAAQTQEALRSDLQLVHTADRNYRVSLKNDVIELPLVGNNLAAISKYQIGLALAVSGIRNPAITLLTESLELDTRELPHKKVARRVLSVLRIAPWASQLPLPGDATEEVTTALREAETAIRIDPQNGAAYSVLISARFLLGDLRGAMAANGILKGLLREKLPSAFLLNQAVFRLQNKQFDSALVSYRQARKRGVPYQTAGEAILWLERAAEALDPVFAFGAAVLNDDYFDPERAVALYQACLCLLPAGSKVRAHANERLISLRAVGTAA
ncbi:MAG: hypothetical protein R3B59_11100 [Dehalococcoidia bacterium]